MKSKRKLNAQLEKKIINLKSLVESRREIAIRIVIPKINLLAKQVIPTQLIKILKKISIKLSSVQFIN